MTRKRGKHRRKAHRKNEVNHNVGSDSDSGTNESVSRLGRYRAHDIRNKLQKEEGIVATRQELREMMRVFGDGKRGMTPNQYKIMIDELRNPAPSLDQSHHTQFHEPLRVQSDVDQTQYHQDKFAEQKVSFGTKLNQLLYDRVYCESRKVELRQEHEQLQSTLFQIEDMHHYEVLRLENEIKAHNEEIQRCHKRFETKTVNQQRFQQYLYPEKEFPDREENYQKTSCMYQFPGPHDCPDALNRRIDNMQSVIMQRFDEKGRPIEIEQQRASRDKMITQKQLKMQIEKQWGVQASDQELSLIIRQYGNGVDAISAQGYHAMINDLRM